MSWLWTLCDIFFGVSCVFVLFMADLQRLGVTFLMAGAPASHTPAAHQISSARSNTPVFTPLLSTWCTATLLVLLAVTFCSCIPLLSYVTNFVFPRLHQPPATLPPSLQHLCIHSTLDPPWLNHLCLRLSFSLHHRKHQLLHLLSHQPKPWARAFFQFRTIRAS